MNPAAMFKSAIAKARPFKSSKIVAESGVNFEPLNHEGFPKPLTVDLYRLSVPVWL
jgi:hypothetical protein